MMKGKIVITSEGEVMVTSHNQAGIPFFLATFPNEILNDVKNGDEVEFQIVDEFTHPEFYKSVPLFEGPTYANIEKIIK